MHPVAYTTCMLLGASNMEMSFSSQQEWLKTKKFDIFVRKSEIPKYKDTEKKKNLLQKVWRGRGCPKSTRYRQHPLNREISFVWQVYVVSKKLFESVADEWQLMITAYHATSFTHHEPAPLVTITSTYLSVCNQDNIWWIQKWSFMMFSIFQLQT